MKHFKAPREHIGALTAEAAASVIAAAGDLAVILDANGIVRDVAIRSEDLSRELSKKNWLGKHWSKLTTIESRPKIETLMREAQQQVSSVWRHVNHLVADGASLPLLYSVIQAGKGGGFVAFGRDLRPLASLQQRLVRAQEAMERDYTRLRHLEMRYRLVFEHSAEAALIVDAASLRVIEANPSARQLLGDAVKTLAVGRNVLQLFGEGSQTNVRALLESVRAGGRPDQVEGRVRRPNKYVLVSASLFRQDDAALFLMRLSTKGPGDTASFPKLKSKMLKLVENAPDGFVMTQSDGVVLAANAAFIDMVNARAEEDVRGQPLERWIGRPGVDVDILIKNLRQRGSIRLFSTTLSGEMEPRSDIEISAVSVMNGGKPCFGFTMRRVGQRTPEARTGRSLPRSSEQLTELIGRVSLKDLVRETTDVIERLCIEAALELTNDNRASAAELLGLSRQSLYMKLRRYGLDDDIAKA